MFLLSNFIQDKLTIYILNCITQKYCLANWHDASLKLLLLMSIPKKTRVKNYPVCDKYGPIPKTHASLHAIGTTTNLNKQNERIVITNIESCS